jgi:hypothetical protein
MSKEIAQFIIRPTSLAESMQLAKMIADSSFAPKDMRGKPGDVILALQMGSEVGLSPIQSIQNIAVINGRPSLYGDAALAVAMSSPNYEYHKEDMEGSLKDSNLTAYCTVKRKGAEEHTVRFSQEDAKKAGLWGKAGPWTLYPARMLQMRARSFAIRDQFADAMRGIQVAESDYTVLESTDKPEIKVTAEYIAPKIEEEPEHELEPDNEVFTNHLHVIRSSQTIDELKANYQLASQEMAVFNNAIKIINQTAKQRRDELKSQEQVNVETGEVSNVTV